MHNHLHIYIYRSLIEMGKVLSSIKHPFRNFNLESRAEKVISQPKPKPAPKYEKDKEVMDKLLKEDREVFEASLKKNEVLDQRLKNVFVTSRDTLEIKQASNPSRPLPTDKKAAELYMYGFKEPDRIPYGRTTLKAALRFITNHQSEPGTYTPEKIAEEHKLDVETVRNILKYHRVFEVYMPNERDPKTTFAGPGVPRVVIIKESTKQLPEPQTETKKDDT